MLFVQFSFGQTETKSDEANLYDCEVPDPLITSAGNKINNSEEWIKNCRPEILDFFTENVYGKVLGELKISSYEIIEQSNNAINGKAIRRQVKLNFEENGLSHDFIILIYLPMNIAKAPVFFALNFMAIRPLQTKRR